MSGVWLPISKLTHLHEASKGPGNDIWYQKQLYSWSYESVLGLVLVILIVVVIVELILHVWLLEKLQSWRPFLRVRSNNVARNDLENVELSEILRGSRVILDTEDDTESAELVAEIEQKTFA